MTYPRGYGRIEAQRKATTPKNERKTDMTAKERKQLETLRNYIEKAIWKSAQIETNDWKISKVNAELIKLLDLVDEATA